MGRRQRHRKQKPLALIVAVFVILATVAFVLWYPRQDAPAPLAPPQAKLQAELLSGMSLSAALASPDEGQVQHPIGLDLFQGAAVGDWSAHQLTNAGPLGTVQSTIVWRVESREEDAVGFLIKGRSDDEEGSYRRTFSTRTPLTVETLQDMPRTGWRVLDMSAEESSETIAGESFPCRHINFSSSDPLFPDKRTETHLCLSAKVLGSGVVSEREVQTMGEHQFVFTRELLGFGTADGTRWGTHPAGF